jgi:hypothetical protein
MRLPRCLMHCLPLAALLVLAPSCAPKVMTRPAYPSATDLHRQAKPRLAPADLGSEAALDAHDNAVEGWAQRGWDTVGRLCQWAEDLEPGKQLPFNCSDEAPPPP